MCQIIKLMSNIDEMAAIGAKISKDSIYQWSVEGFRLMIRIVSVTMNLNTKKA